MSIKRRLAKLEAAMARESAPLQVWEALHLAFTRAQARARLTVCQHLGADDDDARMHEAAAALIEDTPAQQAEDAATLAHWRRQQGIPDDQGVRQRVEARLDQMRQRMDRGGTDEPEEHTPRDREDSPTG
jgi:hypothetical protein